MMYGVIYKNKGLIGKLEEILGKLRQDRKVFVDTQLLKGKEIRRKYVDRYLDQKFKNYIEEYKLK